MDKIKCHIIQKLNNGFLHTWGNSRSDNKIGNVIFSVISSWIMFARSEDLISLKPIIIIWGNLQPNYFFITMKSSPLLVSSLGWKEIITFLYLSWIAFNFWNIMPHSKLLAARTKKIPWIPSIPKNCSLLADLFNQ